MSNHDNEGKKVKDIAKILNWDSKRVMNKLKEMGIYLKSLESEITEEQAEALFRRINFTPNETVPPESDADKKAAPKKPQSTGKGSGVIRRIVVGETQSESEPPKPARTGRENRTRSSSASSGLMSGYSTVKRGDTYEALLSDAKRNNAAKKDQEEKQEEAARLQAQQAAPLRKIRRIRSTEPKAEETGETAGAQSAAQPAAGSETGAAGPERTETGKAPAAEGTAEPASDAASGATDAGAGSAPGAEETKSASSGGAVSAEPEKSGAEDAAEAAGLPPQGRAGSNAAGSVKLGGSSSVETIDFGDAGRQSTSSGSRYGAAGSGRTQRPATERGESGGRTARPGDRPERSDRGTARPVAGQTGRDAAARRGDRPERPDQRNRPRGGLSIPAVDSSVATQETARRDKSPTDKNYNKREQRKENPRTAGQPQKDKYKSAQRLIGEKKGVSEVMSDEFSYSGAYDLDGSGKKGPRARKKEKTGKPAQGAPVVVATLTNIKVPPVLTVKELAEMMKKTATEVIKKLMLMGVMATLNQEIDFDTAALIASEFGITAEPEQIVTDEELLFTDPEDLEVPEDAVPRPPVVVVMGHVDHGKTSLLDAIRSTRVTAGEAGGITQHIGAYMVNLNGRKITFLDTPGHEAFTAMRARGAQVTDVAIIVVAADDGVMPQTVEAINHAKAANVSIVVAVNKIDKEGADVDRVMQEMAEYGIVAEAWGGDVPFVPVSAKKGTNIEDLLETVLLSADLLELKASPGMQAKGTVIEAKLDKNRGPVATLLVQRGTLHTGDAILSETTFGHIRTMTDDRGSPIKNAGPSTPVEITGLPEVPEAGKVFFVVNNDEKLAKKVADSRRSAQRAETMSYSNKVNLEALFSQIQAGSVKELNLIVKADVRGSVEAVKQSLEKLSDAEVRVNIIHGGVGGVTESDISLAEASNAIIIGFNVRPIGNVADIAASKGVEIKLYRVIYDAINDIKAAMVGMLDPEYKEVVTGHVEIRKTFRVSGVGTIAGGYVTNGKIVRNSEVRIVRDGIVVHEGKLASLRRFKDDVKEVAQGFECGLSFEHYDDIKEGDLVESYVMEEIARTVSD